VRALKAKGGSAALPAKAGKYSATPKISKLFKRKDFL
jgi:hypothetical protein